ncbi:MAG: type II secretion system major pseudopilin GspG [Phycisphaera sp.]|nr:MAG: type II secretion system major pseudopilin GspG [Phycisphaera sp.]
MQETKHGAMERRNRVRKAMTRKAFSLIEIMIVLAIIVMISGLVGFALLARRDEAKIDEAEIKLNTLKGALLDFNRRYNRYPTEDEGLAVLWSSETVDPEIEESWSESVSESMPNDPWGNPWEYNPEGLRREGYYDLSSNGPDGEPETEDDIYLWEDDEGGMDSGSGLAPPPSGG